MINRLFRFTAGKLVILSFFIIYFSLVKSTNPDPGANFTEFSENLSLWFLQRYILLVICLGYTLYGAFKIQFKPIEIAYFCVLLFFVVLQLANDNLVACYAAFGVSSSYILLKQAPTLEFGKREYFVIMLLILLYPAQYLIFSTAGRLTSSFLDPNIAGYYLFLVYAIYRYSRVKVFNLLALMFILPVGILSESRNFALAVVIFEFFKFSPVQFFIERLRVFHKVIFSTKYLVLFSLFTIFATSIYIVQFTTNNEQIYNGAERFSQISDGSNYARAEANLVMGERILIGDYIFFGNGSNIDSDIAHRPHNAFLRAVYRYGLLLAALCIIVFSYITDKFIRQYYPLIFSLFAYYAILNDFVTGSELLLLLSVLIFVKNNPNSGRLLSKHKRLAQRTTLKAAI